VHRQQPLDDTVAVAVACCAVLPDASGVPSQARCTGIYCTGRVAPLQEFSGAGVRAMRGLELAFRPEPVWIRGIALSPRSVPTACRAATLPGCTYISMTARLCVERELRWIPGAGPCNAGSLSACASVRVPALLPQLCTVRVCDEVSRCSSLSVACVFC
jgi:hypothetical protein